MFATAFDFPSVDFLAKLDMPAFKVASGDLKNIPLLTHMAKAGKPMILSTGGGTMQDVQPRLRRRHAHQPAAVRAAVHRRLPGGLRGAEPARHHDLPRDGSRSCHRPVLPRQRHRHGAGGLHARRPRDRKALHPEPHAGKAPTMPSRWSRTGCRKWCAI